MFGKFLPKETIFFDFFEKHSRLTFQAAQALLLFMEEDLKSSKVNGNSIKKMELEADEVTSRCLETLHKSFITPLQPDDIFRLISRMDDIIDSINKASEDCLIYKITFFTPAAKKMAGLLVSATEKLEIMIKGLRNRRHNRAIMRQTNFEIHTIENQGDEILREALGQLFEKEADLRLLIKWKEIYEVLEQAIDYCEDVSNIIESFIMEYD